MILLRQYEEELDKLHHVLDLCPDELWESSLWKVERAERWIWPRDEKGELIESTDRTEASIQVFSAFWYRAYHCLFYLDLYLSSDSTGFKTPAPFGGTDEHSVDEQMAAVFPNRVYSKGELLAYLTHGRRKAQAVIPALTEQDIRRPCEGGHPWVGQTFNTLLRINLKHLREHRIQLDKFLLKSAQPQATVRGLP